MRGPLLDVTRGSKSVHIGHTDVHEHEVGLECPGQVDRLTAVARLADHDQVGLAREDRREPGARQLVIVHDQRARAGLSDSTTLMDVTSLRAPRLVGWIDAVTRFGVHEIARVAHARRDAWSDNRR